MYLEGDIDNIQKDDMLDKLASLYSRNDILDKKVRRNNSKVRRHITTNSIVRDKNPCDKGKG